MQVVLGAQSPRMQGDLGTRSSLVTFLGHPLVKPPMPRNPKLEAQIANEKLRLPIGVLSGIGT